MLDTFAYTCRCCGERHVGVPDLAFDSPLHYHALPDEERAAASLDSETCTIGEDRFVRGVIEIPILGRDRSLGYGVWVSLSRSSFQAYIELLESPDRRAGLHWFGWLCNRLPGYPDTLNLKTHVHLRAYPLRPSIELEPTDHPLAVEQRTGISMERLREICETNLHPP